MKFKNMKDTHNIKKEDQTTWNNIKEETETNHYSKAQAILESIKFEN